LARAQVEASRANVSRLNLIILAKDSIKFANVTISVCWTDNIWPTQKSWQTTYSLFKNSVMFDWCN